LTIRTRSCGAAAPSQRLVTSAGLGLALMRRSIPVGRLSEAEDIGAAALLLAIDGAGFVTGQSLTVDGARHCPSYRTSEALVIHGQQLSHAEVARHFRF
jgi:NAD(P)-dependent dehydrogenase (short-subunit alcohol dehydrogenase family)